MISGINSIVIITTNKINFSRSRDVTEEEEKEQRRDAENQIRASRSKIIMRVPSSCP